MDLVKENIEKRRKVFYDDDRYIKVWEDVKPMWISEHVKILRFLIPNYVESYGGNWIAYNKIEGVPASTIEHTDEFIRNIYKFCLLSIEDSKPYVHGDWVLSNIIVRPDNSFVLIDWDNVGIYSESEYMSKLHSDLYSAFKERFYDATGI